jgi:thioredoxin 1
MAELTREEVDRLPGLVALEFGASWCGYCAEARPHVAALLRQHSSVRHITIEDGRGKPLGRSFRVKLWPTFVLLRDSRIVQQLVRPDPGELREGFDALLAESNESAQDRSVSAH